MAVALSVVALFELAYEHMRVNHPSESWNNYVFEFSDGDNWHEDNLRCLEFINKTLPMVSAMGYGEIILEHEIHRPWADDLKRMGVFLEQNISDDKFMSALVDSKDSIFEALRKFFSLGVISGDDGGGDE